VLFIVGLLPLAPLVPLQQGTFIQPVLSPPKPKRVLKKQNGGALASAKCDFCPMPMNHFCRFVLPSSTLQLKEERMNPFVLS
jgi:hypothetical protein